MARRRRQDKHARPRRELGAHHPTAVTRADGEWLVRGVAQGRSDKAYRCPGCNQLIPPGQAHVVVWPRIASLRSGSAIDERRHWHAACWDRGKGRP